MKHFTKLLLITLAFSFVNKTKAQVNIGDSLALVDLYNSTDGSNWHFNIGWLTGPVNTWFGITVADDRVTAIDFEYNNLQGTLPESIGNLTALQSLIIYGSSLSDTIPESIGYLSALQTLVLFANQLNGEIPESIGNLTSLQSLNLSNNKLNGRIPESIYNLTALQGLVLSNNKFTGRISEKIGNLISMQQLSLDNNKLRGNIPESIGKLTALADLFLNNNRLSGRIPESIGNVGKLAEVYFIFLDHNHLTGSIPSSIGDITIRSTLDLSHNALNGGIPISIFNNTSLLSLKLHYNHLSGIIPDAISNLTHLEKLYLNNNEFSGNIPKSINNLTALQHLNLSNNKLSGTIPSMLNLSKKCDPDISYNYFTFEGMEDAVKHFHFHLTDSPQGIIPLHQQGNTLSVSAGGTLANNTYNWYKDGAWVATKIGDSIYSYSVDGSYNVNVTNSICYGLTLFSDTITTGVLPITLLNFTAIQQNKNALLNWSTSQEINAKEFIIQHSTDGNKFTNIGTVTAKGNSSSVSQYSFTDANITALNATKIYYRLLQTDNDGKSTYSKTVVLNIAAQNNFTLYPNPVKDVLHVQTNEAAIVTITNSEGKVVITKTINSSTEINVASLPAGLYYAKNISTGEVKKFVVVK